MPLNYLQQSTNPLFPGVAMRRPPNTHARHAQPKKRDVGGVEGEEEEHPEGAAPPPTKKASVRFESPTSTDEAEGAVPGYPSFQTFSSRRGG
jgi:hypothetical protein